MTKFLPVFALSIMSTSLAVAESCTPPQTPSDFRSFEDVVYKDNLGMDIYLPKEGKDFPVAFIIHGGSWIQGSRKDFDPFAKQITAMGYAAVTVSYRLANDASGKFPAPMEDLRCALKTLRAKRKDFSMNTDRIIALGQSAGAHLAAEVALTADSAEFNDSMCPIQNFGTEVQSVVGYYGPYDLRKTDELNLGQIWVLSNFLGGLPLFKPKLAALASPAAQLGEEDIPFYLVHSAPDDLVPVKSSRDFSDLLRSSHKQVRYVETLDGKHGFPYFDSNNYADEATCGTIETLEKFAR